MAENYSSIGDMWIGPRDHGVDYEKARRIAQELLDHVNQEKAKMAVKLKFVVQEQTQRKHWQGGGLIGSVKLAPVTGGSDENKKFYEATPSGSIEFGTINEEALKSLPVGAEVYVTIEAA